MHDAIILDDVRDLAFLSENQEKLQAKYNAIIEFGTTPSDEYAYHHYLFRVPIAVTISRDAKNREWLEPGKLRLAVVTQGARGAPEASDLEGNICAKAKT